MFYRFIIFLTYRINSRIRIRSVGLNFRTSNRLSLRVIINNKQETKFLNFKTMMTFKPLFKICVNDITYKVTDFTIENVFVTKNETEVLVSYFCNKNDKKVSIEVSHFFDTLHTHTYFKINNIIDLSSKSTKK